MAVGEMIHGADFSLSEAMSALELMDPKMDDGMHDVSPGPKGAAGPHGTYPPPVFFRLFHPFAAVLRVRSL